MDKGKGCSGFRVVEKYEILQAIRNAKKEFRMLGTTAFDIPWQRLHLDRYLYECYCGGEFEITIISESDPTMYSDALISSIGRNCVGTPMAALTEARQNSTQKLRSFFRLENGRISGMDPEEDVYRRQLDALYTVQFVRNICTELNARGYSYDKLFEEDESGENILTELYSSCVEKIRAQFDESEIVKNLIKKRNYARINKVRAHCEDEVQEKWQEAVQAIDDAEDGSRKLDALLAFVQKGFKHQYMEPDSKEKFTFELSAKELQNMCLNTILKYLERESGSEFELVRRYASETAFNERKKKLQAYMDDPATKQRFKLKQIFHPIPVQMLRVDGVYYASINPLPEISAQKFLYVGNSNLPAGEDVDRFACYDEYVQYFSVYMQSVYSTEETGKGNRMEVINHYSPFHEVIGQMPRDSFYGSDNYKEVVWALIFDRKGRILIHKRSNNAKDNQGMWDKSVGGHISLFDHDTVAGATREIAEELYCVEEVEQGISKTGVWSRVNIDCIIYLGRWHETRYPKIGSSLHLEPDEFYSFSFDSRMTSQPIDSLRVLPDGTRIKARCFVNVFFVIADREFNMEDLKNSMYLVLPPGMIKECARMRYLTPEIRKRILEENPEVEEAPYRFITTPDLEYMINSPEWDNEITKFSIRIKEAFEEGAMPR